MQKSTGPTPSFSRVSAAIEGLCAAELRNSEVTLSAKATSVRWVARAGEHGPPTHTDADVALFNWCASSVSSLAFTR
ncbi:hypothetical protein SY2F82_04720 [Streptomyces sp. Y2F8-2]|nr:hypothetical protein SY2F82_04720 [Streptomyces sp. Y2F8-2]